MSGLHLDWQWAGGPTPSTVVKPLVVLFPWVWSEPQYVNKYTQLCHQVRAAAADRARHGCAYQNMSGSALQMPTLGLG